MREKQKKLLIVGAGGHGKMAGEIAELSGKYQCIQFLDDHPSVKKKITYDVLGKIEEIEKYIKEYDFFVAIGNESIREKIQNNIEKEDGNVITLIHPNAVIGHDVAIEAGSIIMPGTVINVGSHIGRGVIVNTASSIDHDNKLADFVHIAVGAHLAGTVTIGTKTWIGAGAVISNNIEICSECMIGAGAVVVKDIKEAGTYVGVPARKLVKGKMEL
ncbi:MAG: acetyltransferase [Lachnospiraceae bacterium]